MNELINENSLCSIYNPFLYLKFAIAKYNTYCKSNSNIAPSAIAAATAAVASVAVMVELTESKIVNPC